MNLAVAAKSAGLYILAALAELGGAYLVWQWLRAGRSAALGLAGAAALFLYGLIQTSQPFNFGRTFAAYGGVFIATALLWRWWADRRAPDRYDWLGAALCLAGAAVMIWAPRGR